MSGGKKTEFEKELAAFYKKMEDEIQTSDLEREDENLKIVLNPFFHMDNYLTRIILVNQLFTYMRKLDKERFYYAYNDLKTFLPYISRKYQQLRDTVYIYSVIVRWKLERGDDKATWEKELSDEFPISFYKEMIFFQNLYEEVDSGKLWSPALEQKMDERGKKYAKVICIQTKQHLWSFLKSLKLVGLLKKECYWLDYEQILNEFKKNEVCARDDIMIRIDENGKEMVDIQNQEYLDEEIKKIVLPGSNLSLVKMNLDDQNEYECFKTLLYHL